MGTSCAGLLGWRVAECLRRSPAVSGPLSRCLVACLWLPGWLAVAVAGWPCCRVAGWLMMLPNVASNEHTRARGRLSRNGREGVAWATWWLGLAWLAVSGYWLLVSGWLLLVDC